MGFGTGCPQCRGLWPTFVRFESHSYTRSIGSKNTPTPAALGNSGRHRLGPVDRFKITLRVYHEDLVPDEVTALLQCQPTMSVVKGAHGRFPLKGRWLFEIRSKDLGDVDLEEGLKILFEKLPTDLKVWEGLTAKYKVDIFCGLFLVAENRGFSLSAEISKMLVDRGLEIGFDIYFDPPAKSE